MEIKDDVKIGGKSIPVKWIVFAVAVLVALIVIAYLSWTPNNPGNTAQVLTAQAAKELKEKNAEIEKKKLEIESYKKQIAQSEARYKVLIQKYLDIQKEKDNVKEPVTDQELRDRFATAGYPMLSGR